MPPAPNPIIERNIKCKTNQRRGRACHETVTGKRLGELAYLEPVRCHVCPFRLSFLCFTRTFHFNMYKKLAPILSLYVKVERCNGVM